MNNTFDFNRFVRLINRQWIGVGKIYLMSLGIIAGIIIGSYAYSIHDITNAAQYNNLEKLFSFRLLLFAIIGLSFISIISSSYFSTLGQKSRAIFDILIPASTLEKFLSSLFYTVILSTLSYLLLFFIIDLGFVSYVRSNFTSTSTHFSHELNKDVIVDNLNYFFLVNWPKNTCWVLFLPFLLNAIFLLGSIAFNNFHFIKTAIVVVIYSTIFVIGLVKIMVWFTKDTIVANRNMFFSDETNVLKLICVVGVLVTFLLWGIAYLKLKEKEI